MNPTPILTRYCLSCWSAVRAGTPSCPGCGLPSPKTTVGWVIGTSQPANRRFLPLPFPLDGVLMPEGATLSMSAPFGIGKSSVAAQVVSGAAAPASASASTTAAAIEARRLPASWISTEQEPVPIGAMFDRLGLDRSRVSVFSTDPRQPLEQVLYAIDSLDTPPGSFVVLDSTTPLGIEGAVTAMHALIQNCRASGRRGIIINQTNKQKEMFGRMALAFMPDAVLDLVEDDVATKLIRGLKDRHGPVICRYFVISRRTGRIEHVAFGDIAHSVEGPAQELELVPYGVPGRSAAFAGLLDALAAFPAVLQSCAGRASAAFATPATASGFYEPRDIERRRDLAAAHDLPWLPLEEGCDLLAAARAQREAAIGAGGGQWPTNLEGHVR